MNTIDISPTKTIVKLEVMFTNWTLSRGHHLVGIWPYRNYDCFQGPSHVSGKQGRASTSGVWKCAKFSHPTLGLQLGYFMVLQLMFKIPQVSGPLPTRVSRVSRVSCSVSVSFGKKQLKSSPRKLASTAETGRLSFWIPDGIYTLSG